MLRDPAQMFISLHNELLANLGEGQPDPEVAWRLQAKRAVGQAIPKLCEEPRFLLYGQICRLGAQVRRLLSVFLAAPPTVRVIESL